MQAVGSALPHLKDTRCLTPWRLCPKAWCEVPWLGLPCCRGCSMMANIIRGHDVVADERRELGRMEDRQPCLCPGTGSLQCPRGCLHIWPAKSFMLWDAASEGALIFPFHAAWRKLARCVNFTQLIFECHISTKTARTWKGIVSSAWKKPQATLPLQEEELLAKQQSGQCSGG